ncbi:E3 ubiquitin-protein ligase At3g02290-like [Phragmites australis]|uniref:E3 ubiquitin-protein ligase At3g02290-like n=1 Tax=Phragmites australis TaxID=29695 RepID=UPI002D78C171|nr:E3 ubiquitin-protein ligase At3g02290-like [Phragmites australis]
MGGFCCSLCTEDFEEYVHPSNPIYRQCISLRHFVHNIFGGYTATFQRLESRPSNPAQGVAPLGSTNPSASITDNSLAETYHLVSRPPPYDADPRYARVQREGLVSRREKSINLTQEESLALRRNGSSSAIEHLASQKKRSSTETEAEYKVHRSESTKSLSAKAYSSSYAVVTSEDEDVCPTCLEEYTEDNPKIITKCCHHFHLGCIYEWMERSDSCPICGKEMEFCESP